MVADEVRSLSQRSAQAARDTSELIESSVAQTTRGAQDVSSAANLINNSLANTDKVAGLVRSVVEASKEQAKGIDMINDAVSNLEKDTQKIAQNSDQVNDISKNLADQSTDMEAVVLNISRLIGTQSAPGNNKQLTTSSGIVSQPMPRTPQGISNGRAMKKLPAPQISSRDDNF